MTEKLLRDAIQQINQLYLTMLKAGAVDNPELTALLFALDPETVADIKRMSLSDLLQLAQEDVCLVTLSSHFDELQKAQNDTRMYRSAKFRAFTNLPTQQQNVG